MRGPCPAIINIGKARGVKFGRPQTIQNRVDEVGKLKTQGTGVQLIAWQLMMPTSLLHKALSMAV